MYLPSVISDPSNPVVCSLQLKVFTKCIQGMKGHQRDGLSGSKVEVSLEVLDNLLSSPLGVGVSLLFGGFKPVRRPFGLLIWNAIHSPCPERYGPVQLHLALADALDGRDLSLI